MASATQDKLKKQPPFTEKEVETKKEPVEEKAVEEPPKEVVKEEPKKEEKPKKDPKERTKKQFKKLTKSNKDLKKENVELKKNVLESLRPEPKVEPVKPQPIQEFTPEMAQTVNTHTTDLKPEAVDDIYADLIDENGFIDADLLKKTLKQANDSAALARTEADAARKEATEAQVQSKRSIRDFEENAEVRRVHKKYPSINPKNKDEFNEMFWDDVRKEIATAPILRGTNVSFMVAADKIYKERYATREEVEPVKKKDKEVMDKKEDQKRNINASVPSGHFEGYYSATDTKELNEATRLRKKGALAERLRRSGY